MRRWVFSLPCSLLYIALTAGVALIEWTIPPR
jgi:bacteriorhodopsin